MNTSARILIVGNDALLLKVMQSVLESAGYETLVALSGREALQLVQMHQPDLVLLDVVLTDMDGFEVCRSIKADAGMTGTYVILLSGMRSDCDSQADWLDIGADGFITRPIANRELLARVQSILRSKATEQALRESEDKFKYFFEHSNVGKSITLPSGEIQVNQAFCNMLGYSQEELQRKKWQDITPNDDFKVTQREINALSSGEKETSRFRKRYIKKDGSIVWVDLNTSLRWDKDGKPLYFITTVIDITERVQAEKALRESEESYRQLFEAESDAIFLIDIQTGGILEANHAASEMYGYSHDELLSKKNSDLSAEPEETRKASQETSLSPDQIITIPLRWHCRKDGTPFPVEITARFFTRNGLNVHIAAIRDITNRHQSEQALKDLTLRQETLLAAIPDIIMEVDRNKVYTWANAAGVEFFGADVIGKEANSYFEGEQETYQTVRSLFNGDENTIYVESWQRRKDGQKRLLAWWCRTRKDDQGRVMGALSTARDITTTWQAQVEIRTLNIELEQRVEARTRQLHETQEQLLRQEKLAVLGQLAGGVGHELRNPLAVINNAVYYLKLVQPDADEKVKEYLGMIDKETHNAEKIITDLLDFARIKTVDRELITVIALVQSVLVRHPAPSAVRVTLNIPEGLPKIYVDPRQMEQVLGNLLVNAYQAIAATHFGGKAAPVSGMTEGGGVSICAHAQERMVVISVQDNGGGILPENMNKLFEPLFTTKAKGIGLGLAVSRKLVEANGGRIEVQSEPGKGATFIVYLPQKSQENLQ
jgi:PAS domain S-box-containing protein